LALLRPLCFRCTHSRSRTRSHTSDPAVVEDTAWMMAPTPPGPATASAWLQVRATTTAAAAGEEGRGGKGQGAFLLRQGSFFPFFMAPTPCILPFSSTHRALCLRGCRHAPPSAPEPPPPPIAAASATASSSALSPHCAKACRAAALICHHAWHWSPLSKPRAPDAARTLAVVLISPIARCVMYTSGDVLKGVSRGWIPATVRFFAFALLSGPISHTYRAPHAPPP
jgi:hypothetical protein